MSKHKSGPAAEEERAAIFLLAGVVAEQRRQHNAIGGPKCRNRACAARELDACQGGGEHGCCQP